jgi:multisubunit Na+/H+ antiporter MnhE subunit
MRDPSLLQVQLSGTNNLSRNNSRLSFADRALCRSLVAGAILSGLYPNVVGAVQRLRPKIMTACAILFGLLPIMWSPITQTGADVMKRIATPNDWRGSYFDASGVAYLPNNFLDVARVKAS